MPRNSVSVDLTSSAMTRVKPTGRASREASARIWDKRHQVGAERFRYLASHYTARILWVDKSAPAAEHCSLYQKAFLARLRMFRSERRGVNTLR